MMKLLALPNRTVRILRTRRIALGQWSVSLTTKMFLLVLIAVMPALSIQAYNEYDLRKSREDDIRNQTVQITKQFGAEMGEIREGAHQYLQVISRLAPVSSLETDGCTKLLATLNATTPYYGLLGVADATGMVRCVSRPTSLTSVADFPFFKRAMAQTDLAVGNYWVDPANGEKRIHFGLRFSREHETAVAGVVFVGLDLSWLSEHLKERGLSPTQSILIADRVGNIIARLPNPEKLVGKNMRNGHAEIMDGNTAGWEEAKGVDGVDRIFGYVPPALSPRDFFLSAGQSKSEAFAAIGYVTRRGILLILLGLLLAGYAAWMGGRAFIQRPIQALLRVTTEWRNGNYAARCEVTAEHSEIGQLSAAFNDMAAAVAVRHRAQLQAEDRLRELNTTLEERVAERTSELVAANRAKSQFLSNMSHEIRTPMNGVVGMLELLLQTPLEPKQQTYVKVAQRSAGTTLSLITSILDLSRIEAGKFRLESEKFNLSELMDDAVDLQAPMAKRKGLQLVLLPSKNLCTALVGDPIRLGQILNNLIGNAIKFTDYGSITVGAVLKEATAESVLIQFEVRDTGIGISDADQAIIFNAFTQADNSNSRRFSGSGLGLSICKDLCALMGGSIEVTSQPTVGSCFRFTARLERQLEEQDAGGCSSRTKSTSEPSAESSTNRPAKSVGDEPPEGPWRGCIECAAEAPKVAGRRSGETAPADVLGRPGADLPSDNASASGPRNLRSALVVEDNAINRIVAVGLLESLGCNVETAGDGVEALAAHARHRFDVIFMDCQMPRMDGFAATVEIRKLEASNALHTPIIALTASAEGGFRQRCLDAGMDDYVTKPFSRLQLETALTTALMQPA
jgi:signal transduction histidine kinase/ActR/RegA family two-component response regulator